MSNKKELLTKWDFCLLIIITVLYSIFALHDLGNRFAPSTTYDLVQGESIVLKFERESCPATLSYYLAPEHNRHFTLEGKGSSADDWQSFGELQLSNVFTWQKAALPLSLNEADEELSLCLTLTDYQASILEFVFLGADGTPVLPLNASEYEELFDENDMLPAQSSFRDSMYFDEIYHGRTAYEFLNGLITYETTHPPLGKIFIALGAAVFGMNPFGWRIAGTLFGITMVPLLYLFAKMLTKNTPISALACFLYAFDFMHFTQTRIATIDVYITFFVILMYFFMFQYYNLNFYETTLKQTLLPLGACGISMGLGIACKWTGAYAGVGLALVFFITLYKRYREYKLARKSSIRILDGISNKNIVKRFIPYTKKTILFCVAFFVIIPFAIYALSYIPFRDYSSTGLIDRMLHNQTYMFNYHSGLEATHPYSSSWYQWPIMLRPVWYYSNVINDSLREGISAFGNPLVWWAGIPAFLSMIYLAIKKKDRTAVFLIIGYLAQYLPWFFVTRITFLYHYFPSVAFVVLMIAYSLLQLRKHCPAKLFAGILLLYGAAVFGLFLLFLPVLSGQPVEADFVAKYLRWFDSWVLTAN